MAARNRIVVDHGGLLLRDPAGVLRIRVRDDHKRVDLAGIVWSEIVRVPLARRPLVAVAQLPFGYPPGGFVQEAHVLAGEGGTLARGIASMFWRPLAGTEYQG